MHNVETSPAAHRTRPRFQFSLFRLMILVTLLAVGLGLASLFGDLLGMVLVALVWCVLPTPLVICAIFGRRDLQAFAIGALMPWALLITMRVPFAASFLLSSIWFVVLSIICGVTAVVTRRALEKNRLL